MNLPPDPEAAVTCFAPPGTSLYGESGPGAASWRRGVWLSEEDFVARRSPARVDEMPFREATESIPSDFSSWVHRETASHLEMLDAFVQERPQLVELSGNATRLRAELETFDPDASDRFREEVELQTARMALQEAGRRECEREIAAPVPLSWGIARRFVVQALLFGSLYWLYRLVRPHGPSAGIQVSLNGFSASALLDVLMWIYGNAHVFVAFAFLGWVFFRRHRAFDFVRNAAFVAAAVSIVPSLLLASASAYGPHASHDVPASAVPTIPPLHLSIAIIVGFWGAMLSRAPLAKMAWAAYPFITLTVVIASEPLSPIASIVVGCLAAITGIFVATVAGHVHRSWSPPKVPEVPLPHLQRRTHGQPAALSHSGRSSP